MLSAVKPQQAGPGVTVSGIGGGNTAGDSGQPLFQNTLLKSRWKIGGLLGKGAFGMVYSAIDLETNECLAIKIESPSCKKPVLKLEAAILRSMLHRQVVPDDESAPSQINSIDGLAHCCRFIAAGKFVSSSMIAEAEDTKREVIPYSYVIMERCGPNLSDLRKRQPEGKFSLHTITRIGYQMVAAIESFHNLGMLHRDIKPGNFCIGFEQESDTIYLIDFGLARRYIATSSVTTSIEASGIRPARENVGFRGTARYASIAAHRGKDLGRCDDLWSLFYMTVEFFVGTLPWKGREKTEIPELKERFTNPALVQHLPAPMLDYYLYLCSLKFEDRPDYQRIAGYYAEMDGSTRMDYSHIPFDWEIPPHGVEQPITNHAIKTARPRTVAPATSHAEDREMDSEGADRTMDEEGDGQASVFVPPASDIRMKIHPPPVSSLKHGGIMAMQVDPPGRKELSEPVVDPAPKVGAFTRLAQRLMTPTPPATSPKTRKSFRVRRFRFANFANLL